MTKGEYLVGINFNPGKNDDVADIKRRAADLIDRIDALPQNAAPETPVQKEYAGQLGRLKALAITAVEQAAMWAVKAATKLPMETETVEPTPGTPQ